MCPPQSLVIDIYIHIGLDSSDSCHDEPIPLPPPLAVCHRIYPQHNVSNTSMDLGEDLASRYRINTRSGCVYTRWSNHCARRVSMTEILERRLIPRGGSISNFLYSYSVITVEYKFETASLDSPGCRKLPARFQLTNQIAMFVIPLFFLRIYILFVAVCSRLPDHKYYLNVSQVSNTSSTVSRIRVSRSTSRAHHLHSNPYSTS